MYEITRILIAISVEMMLFRSIECTGESCPALYSCANCTAVRLCKPNPSGPGFVEFKRANCTGDKPFCDPFAGTCVATPTKECTSRSEQTCLQDGTFPHPTDCRKYFTCINFKSYEVECTQSNHYYDSYSEKCVFNVGCFEFNCNNYNGYKVPYPNDPTIFTYCVNNDATLVNKCNGKDELNVHTQQCEPVCHHEGLIPDTTDCTKYHRCTKGPVKGQFQMVSLRCPPEYGFHETEFQCLPIPHVPSCKSLLQIEQSPALYYTNIPLPETKSNNY